MACSGLGLFLRNTSLALFVTLGKSSPRRDRIPFPAWKVISGIAAGALHSAFKELIGPNGEEVMERDYPTLNESIMAFVPKKPSGSAADGTEYYSADCVRPLSIANTDNRLLCSAVRLHVEPIASCTIVNEQRGFTKGRSMLSNVLDVDESMLYAAMSQDFAGAIFFDFR